MQRLRLYNMAFITSNVSDAGLFAQGSKSALPARTKV